jgi:hypothetical protein
MAAENDAETIKSAISKAYIDLGYVSTMDKKLSVGQDGDILFLDALLGEPYIPLIKTIFNDDGWLMQRIKQNTRYKNNLFKLIDMLRPHHANLRYNAAKTSLFELVFSPEQLERYYDTPRLSHEMLPENSRDFLFSHDPNELHWNHPLPNPYNEMDVAKNSREPFSQLVELDGGQDRWLNVSRQEFYLFLFANIVIRVDKSNDRQRNYWPLFGTKKNMTSRDRNYTHTYHKLTWEYLNYFFNRANHDNAPNLFRKCLQIFSEVWLRRNVICRQRKLSELDYRFEITHYDGPRKIKGCLTEAYCDAYPRPGYVQPSRILLKCVENLTKKVYLLEKEQAEKMGPTGSETPFRQDDCGFFRDSLFEFLALGMLHSDYFSEFVSIWLDYISDKNLQCTDPKVVRVLIYRKWYVCVVLFDVFLFRARKILQSPIDADQLRDLEKLIYKVQLQFAPDDRLVQELIDPSDSALRTEFMPHGEHELFFSKYSQTPAPGFRNKGSLSQLPQTMVLAALSHEIETIDDNLSSARTLYSWFCDNGDQNNNITDPLSPENLLEYWRDPESFPRMCIEQIDQEIDKNRSTKKKRSSSAAVGVIQNKVKDLADFCTDAVNAILTALNFGKKLKKSTVHDKLKKQWKVLFDYDSTPQPATVKAWCVLLSTSNNTEIGNIKFEQITSMGTEVVPVDDHKDNRKLRALDGSTLEIKVGNKCKLNLGVENDDWVVARVESKRSEAATFAWYKVVVVIKYEIYELTPVEYALRVQDQGQEIFNYPFQELPLSDGSFKGQIETSNLRLEDQPDTASTAPNIVGMLLEVVEVTDSGQKPCASGVVTNKFESQIGYSEVVEVMKNLDGYESGNRCFYENCKMVGPAREELNFSPALTDVNQSGESTAQVRKTLKAFNEAWAGNGGRLDEASLQACFRILMQTTGVRVHQLFRLHTTPNFERGRDRRCWRGGSNKRGVAFTAKIAEALSEPKSLSTIPDWDLPLRQLIQEDHSIACLNLASVFLFLFPLLIFLLHVFFFDSTLGIPARAVLHPLEYFNSSLTCCNGWSIGDLSGNFHTHIGNMSHVTSLGACCAACSDFTEFAGMSGGCVAAVWNEYSSECFFYDGSESRHAAMDIISNKVAQRLNRGPMKWVVLPRGIMSRLFDCCVHRIAQPLSLIIAVALWVWVLGPSSCRLRRAQIEHKNTHCTLPAPLSWIRCWGIDMNEVMKLSQRKILYVDDKYVDEALIELLEEAEERRSWPLKFLALPPTDEAPPITTVTPASPSFSPTFNRRISRSRISVTTLDSTMHFASVFEAEMSQGKSIRFVGTNVLEPLSQWEIAPLTELLILVMLTIDSTLNSPSNTKSLKDLGYDDGIRYASGRRFSKAPWDSSTSVTTEQQPLRNVHWFLQGLRKVGDLRNLFMIWMLVGFSDLWSGNVANIDSLISWVFIIIMGVILASPFLISIVEEPKLGHIFVILASFLCSAITVCICDWWILWLSGFLLIASRFRPPVVTLAGIIFIVITAMPAIELFTNMTQPLEPGRGVDVASHLFSQHVDRVGNMDIGSAAWATHSDSLWLDSATALWLNSHAVEYVPTFNMVQGSQLQYGANQKEICYIEPSSPEVMSCTVNMIVEVLEGLKKLMKGPVSISQELESSCSSCFGAKDSKHCCNSCDSLHQAYLALGWDAIDIEGRKSPQCQIEQFLSEGRSLPGQSRDARDTRTFGQTIQSCDVTHLRGWHTPTKSTNPIDAAHIWTKFVQPAAQLTNLMLVSPSTGNTTRQIEWMGEFLKACYSMRKPLCFNNDVDNQDTITTAGDARICTDDEYTCDIEAIQIWSVHDIGWRATSSRMTAEEYWREAYGEGRDGDFQRGLSKYLQENISCEGDDCYDWDTFISTRPIWLTDTRTPDQAEELAVNKIPAIQRTLWSY